MRFLIEGRLRGKCLLENRNQCRGIGLLVELFLESGNGAFCTENLVFSQVLTRFMLKCIVEHVVYFFIVLQIIMSKSHLFIGRLGIKLSRDNSYNFYETLKQKEMYFPVRFTTEQ